MITLFIWKKTSDGNNQKRWWREMERSERVWCSIWCECGAVFGVYFQYYHTYLHPMKWNNKTPLLLWYGLLIKLHECKNYFAEHLSWSQNHALEKRERRFDLKLAAFSSQCLHVQFSSHSYLAVSVRLTSGVSYLAVPVRLTSCVSYLAASVRLTSGISYLAVSVRLTSCVSCASEFWEKARLQPHSPNKLPNFLCRPWSFLG